MKKRFFALAGRLLACVILFLLFASCSSGYEQNSTPTVPTPIIEPQNTDATSAHQDPEPLENMVTESVPENGPVYTIQTAYCDLKFPERWQPFVQALPLKEEPYTVRFSYIDGTRLFDIVFGPCSGTLLGVIDGKQGPTEIYYVGYQLDKDNVGYYNQLGIQDSANVILQHLKQDYGFVLEEEDQAASFEVFAVETTFATLYYPSRWQDTVTVNVNDKTVSFCFGQTALFDICFENREDGAFLGSYAGTPVYVVSYDISPDDYTVQQYRNICAMQDDINVILEHLSQDEKFN